MMPQEEQEQFAWDDIEIFETFEEFEEWTTEQEPPPPPPSPPPPPPETKRMKMMPPQSLKRSLLESGDIAPKTKRMKMMPQPETIEARRINSEALPATSIRSAEDLKAARLLYITPCFKLCLTASNLAILEATKDQPSIIHIIEFDVQEQVQELASLIIAIAQRHRHQQSRLSSPTAPPIIKITALFNPICDYNPSEGHWENVKSVGKLLANLSDQLNLPFRFDIIYRQLSELDKGVLGCEIGEALAVKFSFSLSRVTEEMRHELLCRMKDLKPRVVTLVEKELDGSAAAHSFSGCFTHTQKLMESLKATMELSSAEQDCLYAGLGAEHLEHCKVYGSWRNWMEEAGFKPVALGQAVIVPLFQFARSIKTDERFSVQKKKEAALAFSWMDQTLTTFSAWN